MGLPLSMQMILILHILTACGIQSRAAKLIKISSRAFFILFFFPAQIVILAGRFVTFSVLQRGISM